MKGFQRYRVILILTALFAAAFANGQVGQWVFKAHSLHVRNHPVAAAGHDGKIYVFGGNYSSGGLGFDLKTAEAYDPATDSWSAISDMPSTVIGIDAVTLDDGRIFITGYTPLGGGLTVNVSYLYDPTTDVYGNAAKIPLAFSSGLVTAVGNDGNVIAMVPAVSELWAYQISTNSWSQLADYPGPDNPALVSDAHHLIYAMGGLEASVSGQVWIYDDHTHAWTQISSMHHPRFEHRAVIAGDGRIYAIGGADGSAGLSTAEAYDPSSGVWTDVGSLNTARRAPGVAADAFGRIYAIDGNKDISGGGDSNQLDTTECYQPSMLLGVGDSISGQEGSSFSGQVATFKDLGPSEAVINYTASINWGDGAHTVGTIAAGPSTGSFTVSGTHTYAKQGDYVTSIKIDDADGDTTSIAGSAHPTNAPITGNAINIQASSGVQFASIIGHFDDANPLEGVSDFIASLSWGDLTPFANASVTANNVSGFDISASHTYSTPGTYTFKIELFDGSTVVYFTGTATVTIPPPVITSKVISATEGTVFTANVASFSDADPGLSATSFSGTVDWGDGSVTPASITSDGSGGYTVAGTHNYHHFGSYPVKVSISVNSGPSGNATGTANVSDATLTATGYSLICKGTDFSNTVATFIDANPFGLAADYSVNILWGDGKSSKGKVIASGSGFKVTGSHSYLKRGNYTVTVTIGDGGTSTASATTHINVGPVK